MLSENNSSHSLVRKIKNNMKKKNKLPSSSGSQTDELIDKKAILESASESPSHTNRSVISQVKIYRSKVDIKKKTAPISQASESQFYLSPVRVGSPAVKNK